MFPTDTKSLTEIELADGSKRHLRYPLGARKRIKEKFGSEPLEILKVDPEVLIPFVLLEGLVERADVTEDSIMETLVTAPMADYVLEQFINAFFVPRVAANLRTLIDIVRAPLQPATAAAALSRTEPATETVQ